MSDVKNSGLATGLVSYWGLEEASGTRVDSHGSNDLTDVNTVGQGAGIQGSAVDFEKDNSEYLSITDASQTGLDITGNMSVSFWIKPESLNGTFEEIVTKNVYAGGQRGYVFDIENNGTNSTKLRVYISTTGSNAFALNKAYTGVTIGTWRHIVMTLNVSGGTATYYADGISLGTTSNGSVNTIFDSPSAFHLGAQVAQARYFDGVMDEVGVWNRVLTTSEVSDLYNSGLGIPYEATGGGGFTKPNFKGFAGL